MKLKFPSVRPWLRLFLASACLMLVACGARVDLMGSVPEEEANEVLAALLKADIAAEKTAGKEGMVGVRVDATQVGRALEVMRENGLPRERFAGMGQVFKKEGLISSPLEERARYIYALSQELSNTLSKIDGVLAARVHVVLPERGAAGETGVPSTSAVFIKHQEGYNLDIIQPQIRRLVTNSIPGLTADRVSVIFVAAQPRAACGHHHGQRKAHHDVQDRPGDAEHRPRRLQRRQHPGRQAVGVDRQREQQRRRARLFVTQPLVFQQFNLAQQGEKLLPLLGWTWRHGAHQQRLAEHVFKLFDTL